MVVLGVSLPFIVLSLFNTSRYSLGRVIVFPEIIPVCFLTNIGAASATQFTNEAPVWAGVLSLTVTHLWADLLSLWSSSQL